MYATRIKMKPGCYYSNSTVEIDEIYITGCDKEGYYKKGSVHDYVKSNPNSIRVKIGPNYPYLIPSVSVNDEKYVKSQANDTPNDNLLELPRYE